ncbi:T9SS type B sorting domain-containing protein [Costertonia aggregata]|uniref:T9SS type B sorting domain-containing protein n=1 Tax=Costertonia aggregata TaxID=343403 RepID=A0A7H9ARX7_9FLAO|nr:T9SS type B sorting domain-containing protein [Costertonia aggregata]QLG46189.1 T9SS type B sorting domain-containing protein [Costertonia aggregata]
MTSFRLVVFLVVQFWSFVVFAQISQDCGNAIPICNNTPVNGGTSGFGIDDFDNAPTTGCLERTTSGAIESNSVWYRFRTNATGQLGFNIGFNSNEDWDFALYRSNDCSALGEPIRCNFFDNSDADTFVGVGEDPTGNAQNIQYEEWLQVQPGEDYYLLINNFSSSNSGFSIQFSGNIFVTNPYDALDCTIIDNLLGSPIAACENDFIELDATTSNAINYNWYRDIGTGFQQVMGENDPTLQADQSGMYRVEVIITSGVNIISDVQVVFSPVPDTFSLSHETICSETMVYDLSQKDAEALGGQDPNGYLVTYYHTLIDALDNTNALPRQYPVSVGSETIFARVSSLVNPSCFDAPEEFDLTVLETPALSFSDEAFICDGSTTSIEIGETTPNSNFTYTWNTGETTATLNVINEGEYTLTATNIQNGVVCEDSRTVRVIISQTPIISDIQIDDFQETNIVTILTATDGNYEYRLDDGPFQAENVFEAVVEGEHTVTVSDVNGCGSISESVVVMGYPKFFTPNGDDRNDLWQVAGIAALQEPVVSVYDRYGKLLKQMDKNSSGWDGTFNGMILPSTDYWFKLSYINTEGERTYAKYLKNHFSLRR